MNYAAPLRWCPHAPPLSPRVAVRIRVPVVRDQRATPLIVCER